MVSFCLERDVGLRCSTRVVGGVELQVQLAQADQIPSMYNADSSSFPLCLGDMGSCSGEMRHRLHLAVTISHDALPLLLDIQLATFQCKISTAAGTG